MSTRPATARWRVQAAFDLVWTGGREVGRPEAVRLEDALAATAVVRAPAVGLEDGQALVSGLVDAGDEREAVAALLSAVACAAPYVPCLALGTVQDAAARSDPTLLRSAR